MIYYLNDIIFIYDNILNNHEMFCNHTQWVMYNVFLVMTLELANEVIPLKPKINKIIPWECQQNNHCDYSVLKVCPVLKEVLQTLSISRTLLEKFSLKFLYL